MYNCLIYTTLTRRVKVTRHALDRYRTRADQTVSPPELRILVARKLYDALRSGVVAKKSEIKVQVTPELRAVLIPDNGWVVKSFVPEKEEEIEYA